MSTSKMLSREPTVTEYDERSGMPARGSIQTILTRDHARLERLFRSTVYAADSTDPAELRAAWTTLERELEGHLDLEERQLLPVFARSRPEEARILLEEHGQIRARLVEMGVHLDLHCLGRDRILAFADLLRSHARREDALLYPWASQHIGLISEASVGRALAVDDDDATAARGGDKDQRWSIDTERSSLNFSLRHLVVGQIRGRFARWGGTVRLDACELPGSTVRVWVDLASIDTGDPERDEQVRSTEFFDVTRFPRAMFTSALGQPPVGGVSVVAGCLELHGVTADLSLDVSQDRPGPSDPAAAERSFAVKGRFDRRRFGLRWNQDLDMGGIVVGDEVEVTARVRLVRESGAGATRTE